jgi:hypothetical protein
MPDLDQIKQDEQGRGTGAGGSPGAGRAIPPAAGSAAAIADAIHDCRPDRPSRPQQIGRRFCHPPPDPRSAFQRVDGRQEPGTKHPHNYE